MRVAKLAPMPGKIEEIERLFDRFLAPGPGRAIDSAVSV
jgi:hypothetical protein